MKKILSAAALGCLVASSLALATTAEARKGADDPAGHIRQSRGSDDLMLLKGGRPDDHGGGQHRGRGSDDDGGDDHGTDHDSGHGDDHGDDHSLNGAPDLPQTMARRGADDPAGDDRGGTRGGKGGKGGSKGGSFEAPTWPGVGKRGGKSGQPATAESSRIRGRRRAASLVLAATVDCGIVGHRKRDCRKLDAS